MSDPKKFLERWSKRKLAKGGSAAPEQEQKLPHDENEVLAAAPAPKESEAPVPKGQLFDPASLPPIESIGANTDVTAFLRPGVPPDLTRAALRRAWTSDPAIKDFVGLVENGWDFNNANAVGGFGPIAPQEVARLVTQAVGAIMPDEKQLTGPPQVEASETKPGVLAAQRGNTVVQDQSASMDTPLQRRKDDAAPQNGSKT